MVPGLELLSVFDPDLIDNGAISVLDQTYANFGIFLNVSGREHFAVGPEDLNFVTKNEVYRFSRAGIQSDRRSGRIIGHRTRIVGGRSCRGVALI